MSEPMTPGEFRRHLETTPRELVYSAIAARDEQIRQQERARVREVLLHLPIVYRDMLTEMLELGDTDD